MSSRLGLERRHARISFFSLLFFSSWGEGMQYWELAKDLIEFRVSAADGVSRLGKKVASNIHSAFSPLPSGIIALAIATREALA